MAYIPSAPNSSLMDQFKAYPDVAAPLMLFAEALMQGPSPFSEGERELIAAFVSRRNGCGFCESAHRDVAERWGIDPKLLDQIGGDIDAMDVADAMKPVLRYVAKLNDAPHEIDQQDVDAILAAGWNETAVTHAALVCGFFNLMNRWVDGLGIADEPNIASMAATQLYEGGYGSVFNALKIA